MVFCFAYNRGILVGTLRQTEVAGDVKALLIRSLSQPAQWFSASATVSVFLFTLSVTRRISSWLANWKPRFYLKEMKMSSAALPSAFHVIFSSV
jgi:hypothetical protein